MIAMAARVLAAASAAHRHPLQTALEKLVAARASDAVLFDRHDVRTLRLAGGYADIVEQRKVRVRRMLAIVPLGLLLAACSGSGSTTTDEASYQIDQAVNALVLDARAASITIDVGDGPVTVREVHRYAKDKPTTGHQVDGQTLRLTESGCGDDNIRCDTEFHVRMKPDSTADVTTQAGAVRINGLTGTIRIKSQAASVEAVGLASDEVTVETEAGAASLEFAEVPNLARVTSQAGAVTVRVPGTAKYAVDAAATVGATDVSVQKDPASAHRIQVKTELGAIKIEPSP
jgi:hypothetical protein